MRHMLNRCMKQISHKFHWFMSMLHAPCVQFCWRAHLSAATPWPNSCMTPLTKMALKKYASWLTGKSTPGTWSWHHGKKKTGGKRNMREERRKGKPHICFPSTKITSSPTSTTCISFTILILSLFLHSHGRVFPNCLSCHQNTSLLSTSASLMLLYWAFIATVPKNSHTGIFTVTFFLLFINCICIFCGMCQVTLGVFKRHF